MRQSEFFAKTIKDTPKDEASINAQFLIRAGFIDKLMSGVYTYLPFGLRVLNKIENIIREEINAIGGKEILMPALQPKDNWEKTGRWQYPEMFKLKDRSEKDLGLGWTHEEVITPLVKKFISSYRDLPVFVYQIQNKFRDELRAKSGLLRGKEFTMKDLYSFHADEKDFYKYYEKAKQAYFKIFERCGIGKQTFLTLSSGGTFSLYSHEFQMVTSAGEDEIYLCKKCELAVNKEIIQKENYSCPVCKNKNLEVKKAIEVGNIFNLKDKFTKPFDFKFRGPDGKEKFVLMGCYGLGPSRLMGAIVEACHDKKGIIWPESVAPFKVHLIEIRTSAKKIYEDLIKAGTEVLYDDRDKSAGEKFADADLIGIPIRMVVSEKTLAENSVEIKERGEQEIKLVKILNVKSYI